MEIVRSQSTPVGRRDGAAAETGRKTLNKLVARKTTQLFGSNANLNRFSSAQQNVVYGKIVKSAVNQTLV